MITIGVDPATATGLALWVGPRLVGHRLVKSVDPFDPVVRMKALKSLCPDIRQAVVAVEGQYVGVNAQSALKTGYNAASWVCIARALGAGTPPLVLPGEWAKRFGKFPRSSEDRKARSKQIVFDRLRLDVQDDVADAILIGLNHHMWRLEREGAAAIPRALYWAIARR